MNIKMDAKVSLIYGTKLYGAPVRSVVDDTIRYYYGKDISAALGGIDMKTAKLTWGSRKFFKGRIYSLGTVETLHASQYLSISAIDELLSNIKSPKYKGSALYKNWAAEQEKSSAVGLGAARMEMSNPFGLTSKELRKLYDDTVNSVRTPSSRPQENGLEARVKDLEAQLAKMKSAILTKSVDKLDPVEAAFDRKWKVAMSMISEYVNNRLSVLDGLDEEGKALYRKHLWNDFILVEVDTKLRTSLRKEHFTTKKKYKDLIREKNLIDGFFATVSQLLKFGKG